MTKKSYVSEGPSPMSTRKEEKIAKVVGKKRTFCGCITCRHRKVKCDGRKPKCLRCEKAKKHCEGYGFNLKFIDVFIITSGDEMGTLKVDVNDKSAKLAKRQQLPLMQFPKSCSYSTFNEIDEKLNDLEDQCIDSKEYNIGPFSFFNCPNYKPKKEELHIQNQNQNQIVQPETINNSVNIQSENDPAHMNIPPIILDSTYKPIGFPLSNTPNNDNFNPRILPLVPALEIHHQRKKQQNELDILFKTKRLDFGNHEFTATSDNNVNDTSGIWIHPRLEIDAILTYQALIGSADVVTPSWSVIKKVIFAEKYDLTLELKNRIIDKINLTKFQIDGTIKHYMTEVIRALGDNSINTLSTISFTGLLRSHRVQELIRLFVKSQPGIVPLAFNGSVVSTIVIPLLYKIVGELLVFESSVGLPGDWVGNVSENGISFRDYCDTLKRTYCMVALALTAFSRYKILFDEHGINDGSLKLFKCYISFREMALLNLSLLIKPLVQQDQDNLDHVKIINQSLIERLLKVGLFKELILTLVLAIYQDSNLDIINNYLILYSVLDGIQVYYQQIDHSYDHQIEVIWEWFRYLRLFYKSCSKIDLENYEINDEGFEDIKSDYNLIKQFKFDDYFQKNEYYKIEIKPTIGNLSTENQNNQENISDENDDDYDDDDYDDDNDEDDEDDDAYGNLGGYVVELPKRLAKRPILEDKPPRTFTVNFHFSEDVEDDKRSSSEEDDSSGTDSEEYEGNSSQKVPTNESIPESLNKINDKEKLQSLAFENLKKSTESNHIKNVPEPTTRTASQIHDTDAQLNLKLSLEENALPNKNVNALTGLAITKNIGMTQNEREQRFKQKGKITIPHPSSTNFKNTKNPSSIELSFGIPLSLLELMERTVRLADHKNWCLRKKIFSRNFPKICCDLEEELIHWKSDWDLYTEVRTRTDELQFHSLFHQALYHLTVSFYNSILMFFFRLIKEIDPNLLQNHVTSTISHLEKLRMISLRSDFLKHLEIVPPFWCFFICGSDATSSQLQYRFDELTRKWFVAGNKWIGKQIILEIWKTNKHLNSDDNERNDTISWLDVIKEWEVSGFN